MARGVQAFKRGQTVFVNPVEMPLSSMGRSRYRSSKKIWKDPRMLMEYRRPAFIMASTVRRFTAMELGENPLSYSTHLNSMFAGYMKNTTDAMKVLKPEFPNLTTLSPNFTQNTTNENEKAGDLVDKALGGVERALWWMPKGTLKKARKKVKGFKMPWNRRGRMR